MVWASATQQKSSGKDLIMKLVAFIVGTVLLVTIGGFAFVAFQKPSVNQTEIVKDIPAERFLAKNTQ